MYIKLFEDSTQRHVLTTKAMIRAISILKDKINTHGNIYIDISGNSIPAGPMKLLGKFLSTLNLAGLKMYDIMASLHHLEAYASLTVFTKYLTKANLDTLKELDVSDNAFGEAGLRSIKDLLVKTLPNLNVLNLGNIGFSKDACAFLRKTYFSTVSNSNSFPLKKFVCDNNYLSDEGCEDLVAILKRCPDLMDLQISASRISTEGLRLILPIIRNCKKLKKLNLADTYFNGETFKELTDALNTHTTKLDELNLGMTSIELNQLEILFMLRLEQIKVLNLSYNAFEWFEDYENEDKVCSSLVKFTNKYNVEELLLDGCSIETTQVIKLAEGYNGRLISLTECYSIEYKEDQIEKLIDLILTRKDNFEVIVDEPQFSQIEDFEDYFKITKANKKIEDELELEKIDDEKYKLIFKRIKYSKDTEMVNDISQLKI